MHNLSYAPKTLGYKVEKKIYLGVRERKRLNISGVGNITFTVFWDKALGSNSVVSRKAIVRMVTDVRTLNLMRFISVKSKH